MRKSLIVLIAGLFLVSFSAPALADHPIWEGEPEYSFSVGGQLEMDGFYRGDYGKLDAEGMLSVADDKWYNTETRIDFKGNWGGVFGRIRLEFDYDWDSGNQNIGNTTQNPMDLAYMTFPIPGTPVKIAAGLQPFAFGKSILIDTSQYILAASADFGAANAAFGTMKLDETRAADKDTDAYYFLLNTGAVPAANISALFYTERSDAVGAEDDDPWTLGLYLNGAAGAIKYWGEGYFQGGSVGAMDQAGYAVALGGTTTVGMADVGGWFVYGTGEGDTDSDMDAFQPVAPFFLPDLIVVDDFNGDSISNVWAVGVNATVKPMPAFSVTGRVSYYNRVEDVVPDESYIGTEFDVIAAYKINDYLKWSIKAGYLAVGDGLLPGYDDNPFELNNEFLVNF